MRSMERVETTKAFGRVVGIGLVLVCLLVPLSVMAQNAQPFPPVSNVPNVVNPNETELQRETHFLTFIGSFKAESAYSARAYYAAIDPGNTKPDFASWLYNAGFIDDPHHWHSHGVQVIACDLGKAAGCDVPAHNPDGSLNYLDQNGVDDNVINADSHAIVLNAADLGFVRNQFIRCVDPSNAKNLHPCQAANPKIYTYLENYPVAPFAVGGSYFGSQDPKIVSSAYPLQSEAAAAIQSALTRPLGDQSGDVDANNVPFCPKGPASAGCLERIADVAFEWVPPVSNQNSSQRFGTLYAYQFFHDSAGNITETVNFADAVVNNPNIKGVIDYKTGLFDKIQPGDKFAPNLDFVGFKYHPGVCLICHGGAPTSVTSPNPYPHGGNINGFRFLPLDNNNLLFTSDSGPEVTSRFSEEPQIKEYNLAVLKTVPTFTENDGTGATRQASLRTVITGWYSGGGNYSDDTTFSSPIQKTGWIPPGWRNASNGGPAANGNGAEQLYTNTVAPYCRSCHFNREISLDFGTYANFHQDSDLTQLALIAACKQNNPDPPDPGAKFMPLAHLTFERFWETQGPPAPIILPNHLTEDHQVDALANDFGFGTVAGYCATNP